MITLDTFVKEMMIEAGFAPTQLFDDIVEEGTIIVLDRLTANIVNNLQDENLKVQFLDLLENDDIDTAIALAQDHIPYYEQRLSKTLGEIKDEYIQHMKESI